LIVFAAPGWLHATPATTAARTPPACITLFIISGPSSCFHPDFPGLFFPIIEHGTILVIGSKARPGDPVRGLGHDAGRCCPEVNFSPVKQAKINGRWYNMTESEVAPLVSDAVS